MNEGQKVVLEELVFQSKPQLYSWIAHLHYIQIQENNSMSNNKVYCLSKKKKTQQSVLNFHIQQPYTFMHFMFSYIKMKNKSFYKINIFKEAQHMIHSLTSNSSLSTKNRTQQQQQQSSLFQQGGVGSVNQTTL